MEKISVIIPVYNSEKYIGEAIESVLAQTQPVHEIIVIDDGSIDGTAEIVRKYIETEDRKQKPSIKYIYQENRGPAAARNRGIKESIGDYIAFLDSDDMWLPEKMKKQMKLFRGSGYAMVYCDMTHALNDMVVHNSYLEERGYKYYGDKDVYLGLLRENFIFTPTVVMKRAVIETVGGFDEKYKICEDYKMWLKIAKQFKIGFVSLPLVIRRRHGENATRDRLLYIKSGLNLFKELISGISDKEAEGIIESELGKRYFELGYYYWEKGDMNNARENLIAAARSNNAMKAVPYLVASYLPQQLICATKGLKKCLR